MSTIDERLRLVDYQEVRTHKARFTDPRITITTRGGRVFRIKFLEPDPPVAEDENRYRMLRMHFTDSADGHTELHTSQVGMNRLRDMSEQDQVKVLLRRVGLEID